MLQRQTIVTSLSSNKRFFASIWKLTYWLQQYRKECDNSPTKREESDSYEVAKKLRKEIEELKKENDFLKKAAAFFAKEIV